MREVVTELFERYEREFNAALAGEPDLEAISRLYDDVFIAATPAGVMTGQNDEELKKVMTAGFSHYRDIGTQRMEVRKIRVEPIDELHAIARVDWRAVYIVGGGEKVIDFTNAYLARLKGDRATVFGWITGDEDAELRRHGVIE
ncbi:DUF4440 domain-containing protein [Chelatococcus reniformis]|uniref:Uncharacterized protein n=1 Tax=Chelatococcus reniformis TaxID=1494448 RepID=A0A916XIU8_9HYPH|nr:DUF4440 domain-containing protein [Chelatococcus reniformis]GGC75211.1 hypothetical protein GCM10010994_37070 [Chelatococcus reniformis]